MMRYGVVWHPTSDNLGDDLQTLAQARLLPRVDVVLDGEALDAPLDGEDPVAVLLSGNVFREPAHWPPNALICPVCVGMHFSEEDVWGLRFEDMTGAGLRWLRDRAPIGCRDESTRKLLGRMDIPCEVTGCLTLTLERPQTAPSDECYICCVDVPETVSDVLASAASGTVAIRCMSHQRSQGSDNYDLRMQEAESLLTQYAGAQYVITRRLHCAMACLAIGTPVLLLYNSSYENITRFAPMDGMVLTQSVDDFVAGVREHGMPKHWDNPTVSQEWIDALQASVRTRLNQLEAHSATPIDPAEAETWRIERLRQMAASSEKKIRRLEKEQFEGLHEKFTLLLKEDSAKAALTRLMEEPEVVRALEKASRRRFLKTLPWYRRPGAWHRLRKNGVEQSGGEELRRIATEQLARLGWPESEKQ